MATIRNKCTKFNNNYISDNNNLNLTKTCAKIFDQTIDSQINECNISNSNNSHSNGTRPQLRWSQSFSPTDRQKPNVSTLIRRKSAVERLAETKYNYIKSCPTPTANKDLNHQKLLQKSLSTSALKPSLVIVTQSPTILQSNDYIPNQLNHSNHNKSHLNLQSCHSNCSQTTPTTATATTTPPTATTAAGQTVVTRKRNPSLSSRLSSEGSNLEQQLRQLIADEIEEQNTIDKHLMTTNKKSETKFSVIQQNKSPIESPVKPKPKDRQKTTSNEQILRQNVNPNAIPKQRTIFGTNSFDKTIIENKKTSINNCILRYNSSHNTTNINKTANNSKLIIKPKPITQQPLTATQKTSPILATVSSTTTTTTTVPTSSRQLSISRSKSDVSNRLLIRRNKSKDEIERFFETLGLDSTVWDSIRSEATNSLISTPAHYFESCDSLESEARVKAVMSSSSSSSSSTDRHSTSAQPTVQRQQTLNTRLMQSRSCHALSSGTSIVEKNARVIKWLYNCRKATVQH